MQLLLPGVAAFDAASAYLNACDAIEDANAVTVMDAIVRRDEAFHDLTLAIRGTCTICDPNTCPGKIA